MQLLIAGEKLEEKEISEALGRSPDVFLKAGERLSSRSVRTQSSWSLSFNAADGKPDWDSLEDGLRALIAGLQPLKNAFHQLGSRYSIEAYCGHFGTGFGGGPSVSPETLRELADLGLTLTLKTYWGSNEPEE